MECGVAFVTRLLLLLLEIFVKGLIIIEKVRNYCILKYYLHYCMFLIGALAISNIDSYYLFGPASLPIFGKPAKDCQDVFNECYLPFDFAREITECNDLRAGSGVLCSGNLYFVCFLDTKYNNYFVFLFYRSSKNWL